MNKLDNNNTNGKSKSLPQYINQSDIIYLSLKNIRKLKISEHIKMVTYDILEAFRPSMINSDCLIPKEINFGKEMLQIMTDSWKNIAIIKNTNIDKNKNILTTIPENHPFRYMLFDYIPKEDVKNWNDALEKIHDDHKKFVEFF